MTPLATQVHSGIEEAVIRYAELVQDARAHAQRVLAGCSRALALHTMLTAFAHSCITAISAPSQSCPRLSGRESVGDCALQTVLQN